MCDKFIKFLDEDELNIFEIMGVILWASVVTVIIML